MGTDEERNHAEHQCQASISLLIVGAGSDAVWIG